MKAEEQAPQFGIGQIEGVMEYVLAELPRMAERLGLDALEQARMTHLFMTAFTDCAELLPRFMNEAYAPAIPASRAVFDWIGEALVGPDSRLVGTEHIEAAFRFRESGGNVLLVSNHTSGADHPAMEWLVNQQFGLGTTAEWTYMSGHVVNLFLIPLMLSGGINRIQIFSAKYCSLAATKSADRERWMRQRNHAAIRHLTEMTAPGGKLVVLYPEGGRGEGKLLAGEPKTMVIPRTMTKAPGGLMILPCYVDGATSILPVDRSGGELEFTRVLQLARRGNATVTFGPPVNWHDMQPTDIELQALAGGCPLDGQTRSIALHRYLINRIMRLIAALAPSEHAKGPYGNEA